MASRNTPRKKTSAPLIKKTSNHPHKNAAGSSQSVQNPARPKKMRVMLKKKFQDGTGNSKHSGRTPRIVTDLQTVKLHGSGYRDPEQSRFSSPTSQANTPQRKGSTFQKPPHAHGRRKSSGETQEYNYKEFVKRRKKEMYREKGGRGESSTTKVSNSTPKIIEVMEGVTVNELARKMNIKGSVLIGKLLSMGIMAGLNEKIDTDTTTLVASEYNHTVKFVSLYDETELPKIVDEVLDIQPRPPIVTVMGHVDHGKTTLLDTIRKSNVVSLESGGITQHIAAYQIAVKERTITFIDTPGHEAFTLMRARGAQLTDIVVLVVAADDGIMPQTKEAIDHAKDADVPIIVAINKADLENINIEQAKQQLSDYSLVPEEWGGQTIFCAISALKGNGIPDLLDAILVQSEVMELTAPVNSRVEGRILESQIDHGRGVVCTVIIQKGTLKTGDSFLAGVYFGKVRAMFDVNGKKIDSAGPSTPIQVLGFTEIPNAGDPFQVTASEKEARAVGGRRQELRKIETSKEIKKIDLDNIYSSIKQQAQDAYKIIVKGDADGSVEAIKTGIERLQNDEVKIEVIRAAVGAINVNDVLLASASSARIIGFHTRPSARIQQLADQEGVEISKHTIIYKVLEAVEKEVFGLQKPKYEEVEIGTGEVRTLFSISKVGTIAGSYILTGKVKRNCTIDLYRKDKHIHKGNISGLRRFKNDVKEVDSGYECGIIIENFNAIEEGDTFKVIEEQEQE